MYFIKDFYVSNGMRKTNENVVEELSDKPELLPSINKRKFRYFGHVNRNTKTNLMTRALQGKITAKRNIGRPPISYM